MDKKKKTSIINTIGKQRAMAILALVLVTAFFCIASEPFRQYTTFISIFDASYYIGLMAIGVSFTIFTGGIDLSIGTVLVCSSLIPGYLVTQCGLPVGVGIVMGILIGSLFGLANGLMVSKLGLPPFIATLGTMMVSKGLGSIITKSQSVTWPQSNEAGGWFRNIFKLRLENGTIIPTGLILMIALAIIMAIFAKKTRPGRYILALGSNKEATRLSGVNVAKWETLAYVISGTFAGIAGVSFAAIYSTVLPGSGGGYELDAIAGVVIGGTSMAGGAGSIAGTMIGVFIMSVLKTGLPFIDLQSHWQQLITGVVLVVAVFADVVNRRKNR